MTKAKAKDAQAPGIGAEEWALRVKLAACYRIFDHLGWVELIYNHISVRVPGPERHFLINPFGLMYREVTASNLVKIDLDGRIVSGQYPFNPAGFPLHSAIHAARGADGHCVMHTHTTAGLAIACLREGLSHDNFYGAQLWNRVAYHDFEGVTTDPEERTRMVASLGDKSCLILRNHGLVAVGRSIPAAFRRLWTLERACQIQLATLSTGRPVNPIRLSVFKAIDAQLKAFSESEQSGDDVFDALVRIVDEKDPSYRA